MVNKAAKDTAEKINRNSVKNNSSKNKPAPPTFKLQNYNTDDVIRSLSDSYENKRARQVIEWERVRRRNLTQAA